MVVTCNYVTVCIGCSFSTTAGGNLIKLGRKVEKPKHKYNKIRLIKMIQMRWVSVLEISSSRQDPVLGLVGTEQCPECAHSVVKVQKFACLVHVSHAL